MSNLENMTADEIAKLAKIKAEQEREEKRRREEEERRIRKEQEAEDQSDAVRWNNFVRAEEVLLETDMKFFRDGQPRYFRQLTTRLENPKTGVQSVNTEIKFYPPATLRENWKQLKNPGAIDMFREMVEGGEIVVKDPATGQWLTKTYPARVFDKITNTLQTCDEKTYNLLSLNDRLLPQDVEGVPDPGPYWIALVNALSGNNIEWDPETKQWIGDKEENREWLEKWIYGTVYADIGNPTASLPVMFGPGKVGKNALFDVLLKQIIGKDAVFSSTWDVLHGNFDGFKLGKVVMFIDEVPAREDWSAFKNMTGSPDSFVKIKYGAELTVENTIRYAIGCNNETYPLPVEDGRQMMRVSPIKTSKHSTFAENLIKVMDQYKEQPGWCRETLVLADPTVDLDSLSDFDVGDMLLRGVLNPEWASRTAAQKILNYLHAKYKSPNGIYSLAPLRGKDWLEVITEKKNSVNRVADYVIEQEIDEITVKELYEIYKVFQGERNDMTMKIATFGSKIKTLLTETGYHYLPERTIAGGGRETVYCRTDRDTFTNYAIDLNRYIVEQPLSSTDPNMGKYKKLVYKDDQTLKADRRVRNFTSLLHPEKD